MARTKISAGKTARAAADVIPDPKDSLAPPVEARDEPAPWEEEAHDAQQPEVAPSAVVKGAKFPELGWGAVIEHALTIDPVEVYQRLYDDLRLGDNATEYGAVLAACDRAEQNSVDAVRLARHAKLEDERVGRVVGERLEVLRTAARRELEKEVADSYDDKLKKTTKRAPTIQDVEDRVVANWPDESASLNRRKAEMHAALRIAEGLADSWRSRCATLRAILERVAPSRPR